jgi:hypothetical protein
MLRDIVEVKPLPDFHLWIKFDDGVSGKADLKKLVSFKGVFAPLKDEREFARVSVHPEYFVVCWPNGADLDSEVLYSLVTGKPITLGNGVEVSYNNDSAHV